MWQPEGTYWTQLPELGEPLLVANEVLDEWMICELGVRVFNEWADEVYCFGGAFNALLYADYCRREREESGPWLALTHVSKTPSTRSASCGPT